jgi:hypothetical protein
MVGFKLDIKEQYDYKIAYPYIKITFPKEEKINK